MSDDDVNENANENANEDANEAEGNDGHGLCSFIDFDSDSAAAFSPVRVVCLPHVFS